MKNLLLITLLLCVGENLFAQNLRELIVNPNAEYFIKNEGKTYQYKETGMPEVLQITSDLVVNKDTLREIRSTEARLKGNSLVILIYETNPDYHHEYMIKIVEDQFVIDYTYMTSGQRRSIKVKPLDYQLVLNSNNFEKGKEIRGHTEFKGKCIEGCWDKIDIRGDFKVMIE